MNSGKWIGPDEMEIPAPARTGEVTGDGVRRIGPEDPMWEIWADYLESRGKPRPTK